MFVAALEDNYIDTLLSYQPIEFVIGNKISTKVVIYIVLGITIVILLIAVGLFLIRKYKKQNATFDLTQVGSPLMV